MATAAQFSKNMKKRGRQVVNSETRIVKAAAVRALRAVAFATPGDTGEARSNWRIGIGAPTRAVIPPYAPGKNIGTSERANAGAAIAAGNARIASVSATSAGLKTSIYLTNSTRHIGLLNSGSSAQAPAGFVEGGILSAASHVRGLRIF